MFGTKEYYAQEQEKIRIKNRLGEIFEIIIGHPIEVIGKYDEQYNKERVNHTKRKIKKQVKKTADEIKEYKKNYNLKLKKQKEIKLEYYKKWMKTEKGKACNQRGHIKRRARLKLIINTLTAQEWVEILKEHKFRCAYCGVKFTRKIPPTRDHIIPVSKGGDNVKENIVPSCRSCNTKKGVKMNYKDYITEL